MLTGSGVWKHTGFGIVVVDGVGNNVQRRVWSGVDLTSGIDRVAD